MHRVLFICLGNICRSPTAEGVFRKLVQEQGLDQQIQIDSAGTGDWHIGSPPDARAQQAARERGIDLSMLRARQINHDDIVQFDTIIAMDKSNLSHLRRLAGPEGQHKLYLFLEFAPHVNAEEVPDPYYGGESGFDTVLDMIEAASEGLLKHIQAT